MQFIREFRRPLIIWFISITLLLTITVYLIRQFGTDLSIGPDDITTVVLTAGQSNAVGSKSALRNDDGEQDKPNEQVFVWARTCVECDPEWITANIRNQDQQIWIPPFVCNDPGGGRLIDSRTVQGQSHAGFQIARHIVEKNTTEVVGIIPTGCSGMPIEYWWNDAAAGPLETIFTTVDTALDNLKNDHNLNTHVDIVWWMQGERNVSVVNADERIAQDENTPYSFSNYSANLNELINAFNAQEWFPVSEARMFVANHVYVKTSAPPRLARLQRDFNAMLDKLNSDIYSGADLGNGVIFLSTCSSVAQVTDTVDELHFNAQALSSIGETVANKYLKRDGEQCGG